MILPDPDGRRNPAVVVHRAFTRGAGDQDRSGIASGRIGEATPRQPGQRPKAVTAGSAPAGTTPASINQAAR
jgi:hypothetical protein